MAELRIYNNIFDKGFQSIKYDKSFSIEEELEKYADEEAYTNMMVECYDEETGETFFAPLTDDCNTDSIIILVDNKSVDLDYVPKDNELVTVVFLPTDGSRTAYQWFGGIIGAVIGASVGLVIGAWQGGIPGAIIGAIAGGITGAIVGVKVGEKIYDEKNKESISVYRTGKEGEKLPDVRGASNQALIGNAFPVVIGKHLVSPFIIGNPYTTYEGENGEDAIVREILVVGYAPLKLTDFKLEDTWLAYNRSVGITTRQPVMSGILTNKTKTNSYSINYGIAGWNDTIKDLLTGLFPTVNIDTFTEQTLTTTISVVTTFYKSITIKKTSTDGTYSVILTGEKENKEFSGTLDTVLPYTISVNVSVDNTDYDSDILDYWSNNDVELEILQQPPDNPYTTLKRSEIYPNKVVDTDVNANLLFVIDGDIEEVAKKKNIVYKNVGFINGLRTNTVRFTESCPMEFTVNLDMPAGLYAQWTWSGTVKYGTIPAWMALQWRFYSENNSSSDESGGDYESWHNFLPDGTDDYASYSSNFNGEYTTYDTAKMGEDISKHEGNSLVNSSKIKNLSSAVTNDECIDVLNQIESLSQGSVVYDIREESSGGKTTRYIITTSWKSVNGEESSLRNIFYPGVSSSNFTMTVKETALKMKNGTFRCVEICRKYYYSKNRTGTYFDYIIASDRDFTFEDSNYKYVCKVGEYNAGEYKGLFTIYSGYVTYFTNFKIIKTEIKPVSYIAGNWIDRNLLNFEPYSGEDGLSEKRASFTCKLNLDSCKKIIQDGTNKVKGIEVRAIRVSPNYLNMTSSWGDDNKGSPKQYSDSIMWKSLVTRTFDENRLRELLDKQTAGEKDNDSTVTDDYIMSEIPEKVLSDEDMKKLCVIAIKAKADVNGTIQSQLSKINCVAESFSPFYSDDAKSWLPAGIHKESGYYKPVQSSTGISSGWEEVTKSQYEEARGNGFSWKEETKGSNFTKVMMRAVMRTWDSSGRCLLPNLHSIYNDQNAVSGLMLGMVGGQNGAAALGYEDLNMLSFADGYTFCEEVQDGSTYSVNTTDGSGTHHQGEPVLIRFEANAYIYQQQKLEDLIRKLAICSRAVITNDNYGRLQLVVDKPEDYPKGVINQQNCISGTNTYSWAEPPAGLRFSFNDENDGYEQNSVYCWADNNSLSSYKGQVQSYGIDYVTNPKQLWSLGRYVLACILLQREILTRKIGSEGEIFSIGDTVLVQDASLLLGDGSARIQEVIEDSDYIYGFIVDTPFTYRGEVDNGKCKQGVTVLQPAQMGQSRTVTLRLAVNGSQVIGGNFTYTMARGVTNICIFDEKVAKSDSSDPSDSISLKFKFKTGDIVMFGDYTMISQKYRITKIKPESDGSFTETLVPYYDELYNYGAPMPSFQSPVKMPSAEKDPFSLNEIPDTIADSQKNISDIANNVAAVISSTIDINKYTLDISPEAQSVPVNENGKIMTSWFYISAYLYYMDNQITENITYKAYLESGDEVGTWDGNRVKISTTFLKGDILYIKIKVIYRLDDLNVVEREVQAQLSRLYGADSTKVYKMLFPDGEKIKIDNTGEVSDPEQLRAIKRVASGTSENNTDYGNITLETVPDGEEKAYSGYEQVESTETYSEKKTYYHAALPFLVKAGDNAVVGDGDGSGALFFMEKLK